MISVDVLLSEIGKQFPLKEKDAGEYGLSKVMGLTFTLKGYHAEGLGNVSVMKGKGMMGLMVMDTLVINPFELDAPLFSYDRIKAMGNDTLFLELYETRLDKTLSLGGLDSVVADYSDIPEDPAKSCWYDSIRLAQSLKKKGKKDLTPKFDQLTSSYLDAYLAVCKASPCCDVKLKTAEASKYTEGLLSNGGASTDAFLKKYGKERTAGMFRNVMFGTGNPS